MAEKRNNQDKKRNDARVPSALGTTTVYKNLHFYRKSDVLVQLTKVFCERFFQKYGDRTVDQMVQAARSVKQNIAEGCTDGETSKEMELKLLGTARGSNQELLEDYQDYLKHRKIGEWALFNTERYKALRAFAKTKSDLADYEPFFYRWNDEEMANCAICLCHMVDKALGSFIARKDREFVENGGIRERMTAARLNYRQSQTDTLQHLLEENAQLKAENAYLHHLLEELKKKIN